VTQETVVVTVGEAVVVTVVVVMAIEMAEASHVKGNGNDIGVI